VKTPTYRHARSLATVPQDRFDRIVATLRAHGERVTSTRAAVLRVLVDSDHHEHLTAADVAAAVRDLDPGLHRATVYRTLDLLADLGVVEHVHVAHGAVVYHLTEERHQHLVCESCGAVTEAPVETLDELGTRIEHEFGFRLRAGHFPLTGLCARCADPAAPGAPHHHDHHHLHHND
jgi:Fur family ferric uptake transcriptional regulator